MLLGDLNFFSLEKTRRFRTALSFVDHLWDLFVRTRLLVYTIMHEYLKVVKPYNY